VLVWTGFWAVMERVSAWEGYRARMCCLKMGRALRQHRVHAAIAAEQDEEVERTS
jgi:hypothetical protein